MGDDNTIKVDAWIERADQSEITQEESMELLCAFLKFLEDRGYLMIGSFGLRWEDKS